MAERRIFTFGEIVNTSITKIGSLGSSLTDFSPGSNIRTIIEAVAYFVEFMQLQVNVAFEAFTIRRAKGANLDNRVQDFGITRKNAIKSYGIVSFLRDTPAPNDFIIYADSQVSTQPDIFSNTVDYTLDSNIIFPSGAVSVTGQVTCVTAGILGNVPSGYITNLTSSIPGVDGCNNQQAFTTGANAETDEQLRQRIPVHINGLQGGNESAIRAAVLAVDGITIANIIENEPAPGQITLYISNQSGIPSSQQVDDVKVAAENAAAFGILVNVATPTVVYVPISLTITYDKTNYTKEVVEAFIKDEIYNFVVNNSDTDIKIWDLYLLIGRIPGVTNVKNIKIDNVADDYIVSGFQVIRLQDKNSSITITSLEG